MSPALHLWMVTFLRDAPATLVVLAFSAAPLAGDRDWNAQALSRIVNPPLGHPSLVLSEQDAPDSEKIALLSSI